MYVHRHLDGGVGLQIPAAKSPRTGRRSRCTGRVVDGGVVNGPNAVGLQHPADLLPHRHHALLRVLGAGGHVRVVKAGEVLAVGLAGVGVVQQHLHRAVPPVSPPGRGASSSASRSVPEPVVSLHGERPPPAAPRRSPSPPPGHSPGWGPGWSGPGAGRSGDRGPPPSWAGSGHRLRLLLRGGGEGEASSTPTAPRRRAAPRPPFSPAQVWARHTRQAATSAAVPKAGAPSRNARSFPPMGPSFLRRLGNSKKIHKTTPLRPAGYFSIMKFK